MYHDHIRVGLHSAVENGGAIPKAHKPCVEHSQHISDRHVAIIGHVYHHLYGGLLYS
jgi:hypothetical protein